jgi:hypothetical protein
MFEHTFTCIHTCTNTETHALANIHGFALDFKDLTVNLEHVYTRELILYSVSKKTRIN